MNCKAMIKFLYIELPLPLVLTDIIFDFMESHVNREFKQLLYDSNYYITRCDVPLIFLFKKSMAPFFAKRKMLETKIKEYNMTYRCDQPRILSMVHFLKNSQRWGYHIPWDMWYVHHANAHVMTLRMQLSGLTKKVQRANIWWEKKKDIFDAAKYQTCARCHVELDKREFVRNRNTKYKTCNTCALQRLIRRTFKKHVD